MSKSLAKNAVFNLFYKSLSIVFPLITITYASRVLLAHGIGQVSYAQSIVAYFGIFASLGIPNYGIREIAKVSNQKQLNLTFTSLFLINALFTTICIVAYYSIIYYFDSFSNEFDLFAVVGLYLVLNYFNVDWFYQGKEEYGYIAVRSLVVKVLFTILLFVFIKEPKDYVKYALLYYFAIAGNNLFNFFHLRNYLHFDFSDIKISQHIKPIFIFFSATIAVELYQQMDVTLLGVFTEKSNVGYYFNSVRLMRVVANSLIAIGAVLLPRISKYFMENRTDEISTLSTKLFNLLLFISFPFAIGTFVLADYLVFIAFGDDFIPAIPTLRILSILIFILAIIGGLTTPILLSTNKEKKYFYVSIGAAVINFVLNLFLIPSFSHNGSAIASVITQLFIVVFQLFFMKDYLRLNEIKLVKIIGNGIVMGLSIWWIDAIINLPYIWKFIVDIIMGVSVYLLLAVIQKDDSFLFLLNKSCYLIQKCDVFKNRL